jgi:RNA polymerase sigma-70 factor (ECF subfamily)
MTSDDYNLIERAQRGDTDAIAALFDRYYPNVFRYAISQVGDPVLAEDIAGETFVRLVERIDRFNDQGRPLLAWLFTVARNLIKDHYRDCAGVLETPLHETLVGGTSEPERVPEQALERRLTQEQLAAALSQITDEQRRIILLRFIEGHDLKSVARIVQKPLTAIKALQHRGLNALRRILEEKEPDARTDSE